MRPTVAIAFLALPLAAAACGSSKAKSGTSADAHAVSSSAAKTAAVRSYDLSTASRLKVPGAKQHVTFKGTGAFNVGAHRGRLALDFTPLAPVTGTNLGTMLLVLDRTTLYMKLPYLHQSNPTLKPWLKIDLAHAGAAGANLGSILQFGQGGDPSQALDYLRAAGNVKNVGHASVRGVSTTHYSGTIDLRKVARTMPAADRARVGAAVNRVIQLTGQRKIPVEAWLDKQGRVRRISYRQKLKLGTQSTEVAQKMELFDFGTPVTIDIPSRDEVTDLASLTGGR